MGGSWSIEEIDKASNLGVRRSTLPLPSSGRCPSKFTFFKGKCLPERGSELAEEWEWQDTKHTEADKNYFNLTRGAWGRAGDVWKTTGSANDWQDYLTTKTECEDERGSWISTAGKEGLTDIEKKLGQADGYCVFKKGVTPKFLEASRIDNEKACKAKGYVWDDKWYRKSYCYYQIPKSARKDNSDVIGHSAVEAIAGLAHVGEDALDLTGGLTELAKWLLENWEITLAGVAIIWLNK